MKSKAVVYSGADVLRRNPEKLSGKRLGLLTNPTGVMKDMTATADFLNAAGKLCAMFSPEHGVRGDAQAGAKVENYTDARTGLPVYSTYGDTQAEAERVMSGLDLVLFDMQDVGARFYTYLTTMTQAMKTCAKAGVPFWVLDRINPIGGKTEGSVLDMRFSSFIGRYATPTRSGMTIGEYARYINKTENIGCELTVIPCEGWKRSQYYDETDLCWVAPSPNMPTVDTALVYIGTCLIEGTNLSEARGTTKPFEMFGAPWFRPVAVIEAMKHAHFEGCMLRETYFTPMFSDYQHERCAGLQIHVTNRDAFEPFRFGITLLHEIGKLHPEFVMSDWIDKLLGSDALRTEKNDFDPAAFLADQQPKLDAFRKKAAAFLLYE